jgi:hypothetical protein
MYRVRRFEEDFSTTAVHAIDAVRYLAGADYAQADFSYRAIAGQKAVDIFMDARMENGCIARIDICPGAGLLAETLTVSADGTVSAPREPVYTKNELGDRYGMRSASALGKEWYEHSAGWSGYLKGKNAVEIGKLSVDGTDADLKALCTISVTDLQKAALKAMAEQ